MTSHNDMPELVLLNRTALDENAFVGFVGDKAWIGTGYVKASQAMLDIADERQHQIEKGYDAEHDEAHTYGEIATVVGSLAHAAAYQYTGVEVPKSIVWECELDEERLLLEDDPRDNLIKAAALIIAEIERIDRECT